MLGIEDALKLTDVDAVDRETGEHELVVVGQFAYGVSYQTSLLALRRFMLISAGEGLYEN